MKSQLKLVFIMTLTLGASNMAYADETKSVSGPSTSAPQTAERVIKVKTQTASTESDDSSVVNNVTIPTLEESEAKYWGPADYSAGRCWAQISAFPNEERAQNYATKQMKKYPGIYLHVYEPYISDNWTVMIAGAVKNETAKEALAFAQSLKIIKGASGIACH